MEKTINSDIPPLWENHLPHDKMYSIQIGGKVFRLSGASLSSDGPSYFTRFFKENSEDAVLFIDRSPDVFQLIYDHLQGYYVEVEDEVSFTRLWADAMYYSLPRLRKILNDNPFYFVNIGGRRFRIPKKLLDKPGNTPNYFTLTNGAMYGDLEHIFITKKFIRPPAQISPCLDRCPDLFDDLLKVLRGISIDISSDEYRQSLIKEAKYYRFQAVEQTLLKHQIRFNPFIENEEIVLNVRDLKKSGVNNIDMTVPNPQSVTYARPFIDDMYRILVVQIDGLENEIFIENATECFINLGGKTAVAFRNAFSKLFTAAGLTESIKGDKIKIPITLHCGNDIVIDGGSFRHSNAEQSKRLLPELLALKVKIINSQWKIMAKNGYIWMASTKVKGLTNESYMSTVQEFL